MIIGDGCIGQDSKNARYKQTSASRYSEWLEEIRKFYLNIGIESKIGTKHLCRREIKGIMYTPSECLHIQTRSNPIFNVFYKRWYKNKIKHIPEDISITPQFMANWYMGDGSLSIYRRIPPSRRVVFYTDCFTEEDLIKLIDKLQLELDIKFYLNHRDKRPILRVNKIGDVNRILNYMSPYKVSCFNYKWRDANDINR